MPKKNIAKIYRKYIPWKFKYSGTFRSYYRFLMQSQWWTRDQFVVYQWEKLTHILDIAFRDIPFYRDLYREAGLKRTDIRSLGDLPKLPVINKAMMNENRERFINPKFSESGLAYATTGGSTAEPVGFYREKHRTKDIEWAFAWRKNSWFGIKPGEARIVLEAKVPGPGNEALLYSVDSIKNVLAISYTDISKENIAGIIQIIREFKPAWLHGYPSALYIFAKKCREVNFCIKGLKGITSSSETLYEFQRTFIEETFDTPVYNHYGMSEMVVMASECDAHKGLHVSPEYGILELVDSEGNVITDHKAGRLIGTGLQNEAMPLIRYNVGDLAQWSSEACSCGRQMPMLHMIDGRVQDLLVTGRHRLISMTSINMHNNLFDHVQQYQFYQDIPGVATIKIIPGAGFTEVDEHKIVEKLSDLIGADFKLLCKKVDVIPLTRLGKHRFLDQQLDVNRYLE